jgi:hypothetical protein
VDCDGFRSAHTARPGGATAISTASSRKITWIPKVGPAARVRHGSIVWMIEILGKRPVPITSLYQYKTSPTSAYIRVLGKIVRCSAVVQWLNAGRFDYSGGAAQHLQKNEIELRKIVVGAGHAGIVRVILPSRDSHPCTICHRSPLVLNSRK